MSPHGVAEEGSEAQQSQDYTSSEIYEWLYKTMCQFIKYFRYFTGENFDLQVAGDHQRQEARQDILWVPRDQQQISI